jgi:hypothetical protein
MQRTGQVLFAACVVLAALVAARPATGQETGSLAFEVKNYTSDVKIPKNFQKGFQHAGIAWGMVDHTLVITFVSQNFIKAKITNLTRFGEEQTLDLKPGEYTVTCIGYEWNSTSRDPDKNLAKSAFFNKDVVRFTVAAGKTTTLEVAPVYVAEAQWFLWAKRNLYIPDLTVRVLVDGSPAGEAVTISKRTDKSVAWDDYHGPLKF